MEKWYDPCSKIDNSYSYGKYKNISFVILPYKELIVVL